LKGKENLKLSIRAYTAFVKSPSRVKQTFTSHEYIVSRAYVYGHVVRQDKTFLWADVMSWQTSCFWQRSLSLLRKRNWR